MCGEENKDKIREEKAEKFRNDLHKFLEDNMADVHSEDISEALLYEATSIASFWFGCYLHMLGFLTSNMHNGIEEKFDRIRLIVKEAREDMNATDSV